jgi:hypothetical protein
VFIGMLRTGVDSPTIQVAVTYESSDPAPGFMLRGISKPVLVSVTILGLREQVEDRWLISPRISAAVEYESSDPSPTYTFQDMSNPVKVGFTIREPS